MRYCNFLSRPRYRICRPILLLAACLFASTSCETETLAQARYTALNYSLLTFRSSGNSSAQKASDSDPLGYLKPIASGPGVLVCEPVGRADLLQFGAGSSRWLQFQFCGCGECGKTPLFSSVYSTINTLFGRSRPLSIAQSLDLAQRVGATHVAIGSISGESPNVTLKYQFYFVDSGKATGDPFMLSGTKENIVTGLPGLAVTMAASLQTRFSPRPDAVRLNPAQIAIVGRFPVADIEHLTADESVSMAEIATLDPLCLSITLHAGRLLPKWAGSAAANLPAKARPNHLAFLAEVAMVELLPLEGYAKEIEQSRLNHPNNALANSAYARLMRKRNDLVEERKAAEIAVRCAPRYPQMWLTLAHVISDLAETTRRSRFINELTANEVKELGELYPLRVLALARAAQCDDRNVHTWCQAATAATFNGDRESAFKAYDRALELNPGNYEALYWGSEMFQPKWFNAADRNRQMLLNIANASFKTTEEARGMSNVTSRFGGDGSAVLTRFETEQRSLLNTNNRLLLPYLNLIALYRSQNRHAEALDIYEKLFAIHFDDFDLHEHARMEADAAHDSARKSRLDTDWPRVVQENLDKAQALGRLAIGESGTPPTSVAKTTPIVTPPVGAKPAPPIPGDKQGIAASITPARPVNQGDTQSNATGAVAGTTPIKPTVPLNAQQQAQAAYKEAMSLSWNDQKEAVELKLRRAIELDSKAYLYPSMLASLLSNAKRDKEALTAINSAIKLAPGNTSLYETKWAIYINLQDAESAFAALKEGCRKKPRNCVSTYRRLVEIYIARNDYGAAVTAAEQGLECFDGPSKYEPLNAKAKLYLYMGDALLKLGKMTDARAAWQKATEVPGGGMFGGDTANQRLKDNP